MAGTAATKNGLHLKGLWQSSLFQNQICHVARGDSCIDYKMPSRDRTEPYFMVSFALTNELAACLLKHGQQFPLQARQISVTSAFALGLAKSGTAENQGKTQNKRSAKHTAQVYQQGSPVD
jgi:hypothetical protein